MVFGLGYYFLAHTGHGLTHHAELDQKLLGVGGCR